MPANRIVIVLIASLNCALLATFASAASKPIIEKMDDLPRHSYQLDIPVVDLYTAENRAVLKVLATQVSDDIESDLDQYDIRDGNTIQGFYGVLGSIALLEERWQDYLDLLVMRRALETKEANRLTMGVLGEAVATAKLEGATNTAARVEQLLRTKLASMPYKTVQDNLKSTKGRTEILTRPLVLGNLESSYQPIIDKTGGEVSYDIASSLVGVSFTFDYFIPNAPMINAVYSNHIAANNVIKPDIWAAREVILSEAIQATPVIISVWDSGSDFNIFARQSQLWTNTGEVAGNAIDDDSNGFIDDVHGIAYSLHADKETSLLYPIVDLGRDEAVMQRRTKGIGDLTSNIDSQESRELRQYLAALPQEEVEGFFESLAIYGNYSHGTHVAGIALQGNPFARLLVSRMTFGHTRIPEEPTLDLAKAEAKMFREVGQYYRSQGVRAVNMSWGGSLRGIEEALEAHNAGGTIAQRKKLARDIYTIGDEALREVISGSPDILFITSAGNADNDVNFEEFYPSSYNYPNLLTVGAVDQAGDETSFTSLGKVDLYANGFEVESYVPGGNRLKLSGTSMSSPQVLNLAGKILALKPELTTAQLRQLILDGADEKKLESRTIKLINPKASVALLKKS